MCLKHLSYLKEIKNDKLACLEIRNHIGWYFKGINGSNELKNKPVSLYQLFLFTGKLYQTKKSYNYELTKEEEFLLSNYLNSGNQLEEINHQK